MDDPQKIKPPAGPVQPITQTPSEENDEKKYVPTSTLVVFWIFIVYIIASFIAAIYFITTTKSKIFNLNQIASLTSNQGAVSLDLPICFSKTNQVALRSSVLENEYSGKIYSLEENISSQSATLHSSITLKRGRDLFTYYINKDEIRRVTFYDPRSGDIKHRTIEGLQVGDNAIIRETLNLRRSPEDSKTKIEIEIL